MKVELLARLTAISRHMAGGFVMLCLISSFALATPAFMVSGTVTDAESNEPVTGVAVLIKGTTFGAYTDENGKYQLDAPDQNSVLVFSFIGYDALEVPINGRSTVDVKLTQNISTLDEVVVTGYGTQKQKEVTSSIVSVKSEDFNKGNITDVSQLLQGKVAGLGISRPGSDPNGGFQFRLRGLSTIGANTQPLVVIDGVIGADLNSVDPNDIESIDILKDGSAAAIYGTRGSSGVILVTTKQGSMGSTRMEYNGYITAEEPAKFVSVMNAEQYNQTGAGTNHGSSTNWFEELTETALSQKHSLSLSGGTAQTTYRASANFLSGNGIQRNTGLQQIIGRLNLTQRALNDKLKVTINLGTTLRDNELGFDEAFRYATIYNPTAPILGGPEADRNDGYWQEVLFDYRNPVAIIEQNVRESEIKRINANIQGSYEIIDGLTASINYAQNRQSFTFSQYFDKNSFLTGADRNGFAERRTDNTFNQLFELTGNYNKLFGELNVNLLGGYSWQEFVNDGFGLNGGNFLTDAFTFNNLGASLDFPNGLGGAFSYKNSSRLVAFFGRLNLSLAGTYFLNASFRREGSSQFGAENKWGNFPAVSAGVTLSNLMDIPAIDNLKFRVSYGRTGNLPPGSYISLLRLGPSGNFFSNGEYVPSFAPTSNANPDLKWETKDEYNIGVDFAMFGERLRGSLEYYIRETKDLIFALPVPVPPNLVGTTQVNVGQLDNSGFEAVLSYDFFRGGDFTWTSDFNISTFKTELVSLSNPDEGLDFGTFRLGSNLGSPGQNNTPLIRAEEGQEIGLIWGKTFEGLSDDGKWVLKDLNGDGQINDDDESVIGTGFPDFTVGLNNTFTLGNWDLNFFLRGVFGHDMVNTFRAFYEVNTTSYNIVNTKFYDPNITESVGLFSSTHVEDADFVKLDNATLGYTFNLPGDSPFSRIRLYIAGQNLIVISDYTGVDPEVRYSDPGGLGNLAPGIDRRNTWFRSRSYTAGINLGF